MNLKKLYLYKLEFSLNIIFFNMSLIFFKK